MSTAVLQHRVDSATARLDNLVAQHERRELRRAEAEDAERDRLAAEKARRHAERKREIMATYADAFRSLNAEVPLPLDDELPGQFRCRSYDRLRRKLDPAHELADIRSDDIVVPSSPEVFAIFEAQLLEAARQEGTNPSWANLPPSGELIARNRVESSNGQKFVEWHGRRSFIADMSRPARHVACIIDRNTGQVIWGKQLPRAS